MTIFDFDVKTASLEGCRAYRDMNRPPIDHVWKRFPEVVDYDDGGNPNRNIEC